MKAKIHDKGYTLIEIMIALAVFSILSLMTSRILLHSNQIKTSIDNVNDKMGRIHTTVTIIKNNIKEATQRNITINHFTNIPAFIGDNKSIEFTRGGISNNESKNSSLRRVAFICNQEQLILRVWDTLDSINHKDFHDKVILNGLKECDFAFINHNKTIVNKWDGKSIQQNQKPEILPIAVRVNLTEQQLGNMNLLFIIPESLYG